jgi:hypothetical protein
MEITENNIAEILADLERTNFQDGIKLVNFGLIWEEHLYKHIEKSKMKEMYNEGYLNNKRFDIKNINKLLVEIPKHFQKHSPLGKKYWNTNSSYGSKHHIENIRAKNGTPEYCSNGDFIFAMLHLGYEIKKEEEKKEYFSRKNKETNLYETGLAYPFPNVTFNCSHRDLSKIICDCGLQYSKNSKKQHEKSKSHTLIMYHKNLKI